MNEAGFNDYMEIIDDRKRRCSLQTDIEKKVKDYQHAMKQAVGLAQNQFNGGFGFGQSFSSNPTDGYEFYFNYELNTRTWRQFVNKQIMQTYHRLVIEKQLKEAKKVEKELKDKIEEEDRKIKQIKLEK